MVIDENLETLNILERGIVVSKPDENFEFRNFNMRVLAEAMYNFGKNFHMLPENIDMAPFVGKWHFFLINMTSFRNNQTKDARLVNCMD